MKNNDFYESKVMTKYVCGFLFSPDYRKVVLIRKKRPPWQNGLLNGIGGHIENGEGIYDAMYREFKEETDINIKEWRQFAILQGKDWKVFFYASTSELYNNVKTTTDEEVIICNVIDVVLANIDAIDNLKWLIPVAKTALIENNIFINVNYENQQT
jgi:ADP-ribose pyrophosphatase YjhB (NUDIX family)